MYRISEWNKRYEVSIKGREPKDGEELRAGPLAFIRLKVHGHRQGAGYRRLKQICGDRLMEVFGIFCKLLEISGNQPRERRGAIYNEKDQPANVPDIAFLIGISEEQAIHALEKLSEVGWIISPLNNPPNTTQLNTTQLKGTEISGNFRKEITYTLENCEQACIQNCIPPANAKSYLEHYASQGWKKGNGQLITNIQFHMKKRWNQNKQCWDFDEKRKGEQPDNEGKTRLFPISGKVCGQSGCGLPAVYKSSGTFDHYYCQDHMPAKVKEKYYA